jgi:hypothetical protein
MELVYGDPMQAAQQARRVLARKPSFDPSLRAAAILAATGAIAEAESIAGELVRAHPQHTLITCVLGPMVGAAAELRRQRPEAAIERLRVASPYELGFVAALGPVYLRGRAYLMQGAAPAAAAEFQRVLDHPGVDPFSPLHAVSSLGLARARTLAGDLDGSREAYERFLAQWLNADPEVAVLRDARQEYAHLKRRAALAAEAR